VHDPPPRARLQGVIRVGQPHTLRRGQERSGLASAIPGREH